MNKKKYQLQKNKYYNSPNNTNIFVNLCYIRKRNVIYFK